MGGRNSTHRNSTQTSGDYDYIIAGGGTAGCVLAARLTEDAHTRVLLLEAGPAKHSKEVRIPAAFPKLFKSRYDWDYLTEPQPGMFNRRLYWPRGRALGGSSAINAMVYIRGHRSDYDQWAALGNPGWDYASLLPLFKRAEHNERGASEFHGTGGAVNVADLRCVNPVMQAWVEAAVEAGLPRNADFNGAQQEGAGLYQVTQKKGARHSAYEGYLRPALARPNLTVETEAQATRIILEGKRAVGVAYEQGGEARQAHAAAEVILTAGAITSPHLLMLSGIGPAEHLRRHGIAVIHDLPGVGENLQDHLFLPVAFHCTQPVTLAGAESPANLLRYLLFRKGPLTTNVAEAGGFTRTRPELTAPDLQFLAGAVWYLEHGFTNPGGHGFTVGPTLLRPRSRGSIRLRSAVPTERPAIQPNYLSEAEDVAVLVEGIKLARRIVAQPALAKYRGAEYLPGAAVQSEAQLVEYVRQTAETVYHPVGTCKMGTDALAVVDAELRVCGVEGLRVADASIMPLIPRGNTQAAVFAIAEKAAEVIAGRKTQAAAAARR